MRFFNIALAALATSVSTTLACKCIDLSTIDNVVSMTEGCCGVAGGTMNGDDCTADTISEKIRIFGHCCSAGNEYDTDCYPPN